MYFQAQVHSNYNKRPVNKITTCFQYKFDKNGNGEITADKLTDVTKDMVVKLVN